FGCDRIRPCLIVCILVTYSVVPTPRCAALFFHAPTSTHIYTLSLHDALPISLPGNFGRDTNTDFSMFGETGIELGLQVTKNQLEDRKSTRLNSSHLVISYAVFCLKKKKLLTLNDQTLVALKHGHSTVGFCFSL